MRISRRFYSLVAAFACLVALSLPLVGQEKKDEHICKTAEDTWTIKCGW